MKYMLKSISYIQLLFLNHPNIFLFFEIQIGKFSTT